MEVIKNGIDDDFQGQLLKIAIHAENGVPQAFYANGSQPIHKLARCYGYSLRFHDCDVYA